MLEGMCKHPLDQKPERNLEMRKQIREASKRDWVSILSYVLPWHLVGHSEVWEAGQDGSMT